MDDQNGGKILFRKECYAIQGAIYEVYRMLGRGFLEAVYQEALEIELHRREIPFVAQQEMRVLYKGEQLKHRYIADLVCYDCVLLELKAVEKLVPAFEAQVLNYLNISQIRVGLLVNFGHFPSVEIRRLVK